MKILKPPSLVPRLHCITSFNLLHDNPLLKVQKIETKKSILKYPQSFALWTNQLFPHCQAVKEIAICGPEHLQYAMELKQYYLPFSVFTAANESDSEIAVLEGRDPEKGKTEIFVCSNYSCQLPCANPSDALKLLN